MIYYALNSKRFLPEEFCNQIGVYIIYALNDDLSPQPIGRVLKTDHAGILYIGQTTRECFKIRLEMMKRVMKPDYKATAHSGFLNYKRNSALQERFPITSLYVSLFPCENPRQQESAFIQNYFLEYGEVPPLNGVK